MTDLRAAIARVRSLAAGFTPVSDMRKALDRVCDAAAERAAGQPAPASEPQAEPQEGDLLHTMMEWARTEEGRKQLADSYRPHLWACAKRVADPQNEAATCRHWCGDIEHCQPIASAPAQAEPPVTSMDYGMHDEPPAAPDDAALVERLRDAGAGEESGSHTHRAIFDAIDRIAALTAERDEQHRLAVKRWDDMCAYADRTTAAESALAAAPADAQPMVCNREEDAQPMAWCYVKDGVEEPFFNGRGRRFEKYNEGWTEVPLYSADAIAALRAERDRGDNTIADINDCLRTVLQDGIDGMERERIEDLAAYWKEQCERAERAERAAEPGPRRAAWVSRTDAGWLQLIVAGIVLQAEYAGDWDAFATKAAELNSEIFRIYASPPLAAASASEPWRCQYCGSTDPSHKRYCEHENGQPASEPPAAPPAAPAVDKVANLQGSPVDKSPELQGRAKLCATAAPPAAPADDLVQQLRSYRDGPTPTMLMQDAADALAALRAERDNARAAIYEAEAEQLTRPYRERAERAESALRDALAALEYADNCAMQAGIDPDQPPRMRIIAALAARAQTKGAHDA